MMTVVSEQHAIHVIRVRGLQYGREPRWRTFRGIDMIVPIAGSTS